MKTSDDAILIPVRALWAVTLPMIVGKWRFSCSRATLSNRTFCDDGKVLYLRGSDMVAISHVEHLKCIWELHFKFDFNF